MRPLTFLFYHYGGIPKYLRNAIEHVRVFNPSAEIMLITDGIGDISILAPFSVRHHQMSEFPSDALAAFRQIYQHISCFKERYERFVLERWFVTESIRQSRPERVYIMQDSDVCLCGDAAELLSVLGEKAVLLSGRNPHFTFVQNSVEGFLEYILAFYQDPARLREARYLYERDRWSPQIFTQGEMRFLFDYLPLERELMVYETDTVCGYVDCNIHLPEGFDHMQLRRRPRKKVLWKKHEGRLFPHFLREGRPNRAFLLHFQGPGKRVFFRFNSLDGSLKIPLPMLNLLFKQKWLAQWT
jgi:hypothetical protein